MTIIFYIMSYRPYLPNLGSLSHPHGLEEAPVVHRHGPGWQTTTTFMYCPKLGAIAYLFFKSTKMDDDWRVHGDRVLLGNRALGAVVVYHPGHLPEIG